MTHDPVFFFSVLRISPDIWGKNRETQQMEHSIKHIANNCQVVFDKKRTKKFVICCDNMSN